jgi:hypothetical protein
LKAILVLLCEYRRHGRQLGPRTESTKEKFREQR